MKRFFDFSNGFFHKGVAHLYALVGLLLYVCSMILLISAPKVASLSVALINVIIVPVVVTSILSILTLLQGNEKMFRVYSLFTIGYAIIDGIVLTVLANALNIEAIQKLFEYSVLIATAQRNVLPAISLVVSVSIAITFIGTIFSITSLVLVARNIKPKLIKKKEELESELQQHVEIESEIEVE